MERKERVAEWGIQESVDEMARRDIEGDTPPPFRLLLAEDHDVVAEGFAMMLTFETDLKVPTAPASLYLCTRRLSRATTEKR